MATSTKKPTAQVIQLPGTTSRKATAVATAGPSFGSQVMVGVIVGLILIHYQDSRRRRR